MNPEPKRTILLASIGTSPGVLTNAVWALAWSDGIRRIRPDKGGRWEVIG